ncbi:MAG: WG repeat-containing protein, partial [Rikenellaceae bacterium]|nr:WG repeat-containing protein [Rikenellaceae bacterium]
SLVSVDGRPRLITYDGKFLLAGLEYDELKPLSDGWAAFSRQGKWGYADIHGNIVVEPRFDAAGNMHDGFAPVCLNGKWGYIDSSGECVTGFEYDRAMGVRNGVAIVYKGGKMVEMSIKNKIKR